MNRYFIPSGNIQFPSSGPGKVLLPIQEVTPGSNPNLLGCEVDESVLVDVAGTENWGNEDAQAIQQAWLTDKFVGDTCQLLTPEAWAELQPTLTPEAAGADLVAAAKSVRSTLSK